MPTSTVPSLLSRLSPLPGQTPNPESKSSSPHDRSSNEAACQALFSTSTSPSQSHSLSKSQTSRSSPRKPKSFGGAGSHLSSLPDEVLQQGRPIPPSRSTNSSRWASSPPTQTHTVKKGFSPSNPPPTSSAPSTSPALQQIEVMLSQLRTTGSPTRPSSSPSSRSFTHPSSFSPAKTSSFLSSSRSPARPDSILSRSPSNRPAVVNQRPATNSQTVKSTFEKPADGGKRPALEGKSRWARENDEEPASIEAIEAQQANETIQETRLSKETELDSGRERLENGKVEVPGASEEKQALDLQGTASPNVPSSPAFAPTLDSESHEFEPSHVTPFHIDWADDDDDALPDLDDWGVTTEILASTEQTAPEPPLSPTLSTTSTMSNRSKRNRRRNSASFTQHPPIPSEALPHQAPPPSRFQQPRPPKPATNRLFNSARAAALTPSSPAPSSLPPSHPAKQTPPHQKLRPVEPAPSSQALESNWRTKGPGPSPALFSKLSGMGGKNGGGGETAKGGEGGGTSRRSRRGRSRTSSAAGNSSADPPASEKKSIPSTVSEDSKDGAWTKVGGGGTRASRWA